MLTKVLKVYFILYFTLASASEIVIKSLSIRHIRKNDFGLIFGKIESFLLSNFILRKLKIDAVLVNKGQQPKETLNFEIKSEKCCLLVHDEWSCDVTDEQK